MIILQSVHTPSSRAPGKPPVSLRALLVFGASLVLYAASSMAAAPDTPYPDRPIRLIVPSAAAGSPDTIMRIIANQLTKQLKQQVVVDNRPGASYTIGTALMVKAPADGYTIAYANLTSLVINRFYLEGQPLYDIDRDLVPVVQTHYQPNVLLVSPSLPIKSVTALIAYAKAHPGRMFYGSAGNGTSSHVAVELFKTMTGTQIEHVPYKGSPQAINDLMAGQIQLTLNNLVTVAPLIKSKKIQALGVTSPKRSRLFPELPTIAESGVPGYDFTVWGGLIVPAATPKSVVARLNSEVNKMLELPAVQDQFDALGNTLVGGTPAEFSSYIAREARKWGPLSRNIKLKSD